VRVNLERDDGVVARFEKVVEADDKSAYELYDFIVAHVNQLEQRERITKAPPVREST